MSVADLRQCCSKNRLQNYLRRVLLCLLGAAAVFLPGFSGAAADEKPFFDRGGYRPVLFVRIWEETRTMALLGGFKDGAWYSHKSLPIMVQGAVVDLQNPPLPSTDEPIVCSTALVSPQDAFVLYTSAGREPNAESVFCENTWFSYMHVSGEVLVDVVLNRALSEPKEKLLIGLNGEWNAFLSPTIREEGEGSVTFGAKIDEKGIEALITLKFVEKDEGLLVYEGSVSVEGKTVPLSDPMSVYIESLHDLEAFFLDLNGDGRMEFILYSMGPACALEAYDIKEDSAVSVFFLDLGE